MNILILDDDTDLSTALKSVLENKQFTVDCSACAEEATSLVTQNNYDMVLLDFSMPERDGIWFMENAKLPRNTKVLLMTGYLSRNLVNRMFELGACGYMIKPFDDEDLMHNLDFHLGTATKAESTHKHASL